MIDNGFYKIEQREKKVVFEAIYRFARLNSLKQTGLIANFSIGGGNISGEGTTIYHPESGMGMYGAGYDRGSS
jgi:hypothetical protein